MKFIGGAIKKPLSSGSREKKMSRAGRTGADCCRSRVGATRQVEHRSVLSLLVEHARDVLYRLRDGT